MGLFIWGELARLGEVIFIPRSYGIFYLTAKSLLRHCKKIVLITWLLSGKLYIFNMDSNNFRLQQFHFTVLWIWSLLFLFFCNFFNTVYLYTLQYIFQYSISISKNFTYISFTYIRFYLSGSTRRSQFEIEFGKNSKTFACALKKNLSHLARLALLHMFICQIFISPRWDPGKIKWDPT